MADDGERADGAAAGVCPPPCTVPVLALTLTGGLIAGRALAAHARSARMAIASSMEARRRGALALATGRVWRGEVRGSALHSHCLWGGYGSQPQRTSIYTFGGESCAATHPIALVYDVNRAVMSAFGDLNFVTCAVAALAYGPRCVSVCPRWAFVM